MLCFEPLYRVHFIKCLFIYYEHFTHSSTSAWLIEKSQLPEKDHIKLAENNLDLWETEPERVLN